ncbi:MAG TPA: M23 family metallopeptidase [Chitinophagaceae bacterium]|nr:M23 family metallopeptidase [Chitinophagaceae bacterium]
MKFLTGFSFCLLFLPLFIFAQSPNYPKGYFRNPLNIPMQLVANFGELRANHWHMGLDIRTLQRENLPVHAAAEGYIAKVKIEPGGFGRAIYINHPNGYTTLYAHLNNFSPELEQYIKAIQYKVESWAIEVAIPSDLFPVRKGDFIAFSGNTGGSQGPHVHFEIRDTKSDDCLNPLFFGFPIADAVPPTISRVAIYDRSKSIYAGPPKIVGVKKSGNSYSPAANSIVQVSTNKISFAITATDRLSNSANPNGIYSARLFMDDVLQSEFILDGINYNETRYLNAHIDYRYKATGGPYVQHLSRMPGDTSDVYANTPTDGVLQLNDSEIHKIRIECSDANGNVSVFNCGLQFVGGLGSSELPGGGSFFPKNVNVYESEAFELFTSEYGVYDTVKITYTSAPNVIPNGVSEAHTFGSAAIPVHDSIRVRIKPTAAIGDIRKVIIRNISGTKTTVERVTWQNGWVSAKFRQLGIFQVFIDTEPPTINAPPQLLNGSGRIVFIPRDNFKAIKNFRAELDGQWLRFTNDKGASYIYKVDEKLGPGEHELKVRIEDIAGNVTTRIWTIKR